MIVSTKFKARTAPLAAAASCMICLGMSVTSAAATTLPPSAQGLVQSGVVYDYTRSATAPDYLSDVASGAVMVLTPGTDDTGQGPRTAILTADRTTLVVNYPQSAGPLIAGTSGKPAVQAPTYDQSKEIAVQGNLAVMEAFQADPNVTYAVYTGYSQGADALGDAVERAVKNGTIDPSKSLVILTSDPRGPWGVKQAFQGHPIVEPFGTLFGASINGARDPGKTGDVEVRSIIVTADPVANWQWVWYRPGASLKVNMAGFKYCHSVAACYGDLEQYGEPETFVSEDGNTTYLVYKSLHPLTLEKIAKAKERGVTPTSEQVARWERESQAYYPMSMPSVYKSAVPVTKVNTPAPLAPVAQPVVASARVAPTSPETPEVSAPASAPVAPASALVEAPVYQEPTATIDSVGDASSDAPTTSSTPAIPEPTASITPEPEPAPVSVETPAQELTEVSEPTKSDEEDSSTSPASDASPATPEEASSSVVSEDASADSTD